MHITSTVFNGKIMMLDNRVKSIKGHIVDKRTISVLYLLLILNQSNT